MPTWILLLGLSVPLAMALYRKYGSTPPQGLSIDPTTGQVVGFDTSAPGFVQQVVSFVTNLVPSQGALDFIRSTESLSLVPYRDPVGLWTIGYGHKIVASDPYWPYGSIQSISQDEAEALFEQDVNAAADIVRKYVAVPLSQGQFDSLTDFVFNAGERNFAQSTLLQKLNAQDYQGASAEFTRWVYGTTSSGAKVVLAGLVTRRLQEQATFNA